MAKKQTSHKENTTASPTPRWASKLGFIMTAAGAAVGLGNLQRFPQLVAQHGGGAFLLLYLACIVCFGLPIMLTELALGRAAGMAPIKSFTIVAPPARYWRYIGALGALIAFAILSYYTVICAWTLAFMIKSFDHTQMVTYDLVASKPSGTIPLLLLFYALITAVVWKGLNDGVEKFSKLVMPALFIIQLLLIVKILSLPGSFEGLSYYLKPDFSKLRPDSLFIALSQAFFSLCIGEAVLLTYGSFSSKKESLPLSACYIALLDTGVAFLAGLIIIPAAYITQQDPNQGIGLIYNTLFTIFQQMPGGSIFLALYFIILAIAGLTTCITLLDVASHGLSQVTPLSKSKSTLCVSLASLFLGIPSLYAKGGSPWLTEMTFLDNQGFCDIMDFLWGSVAMVVCGLLTTLFVGWIWGSKYAMDELSLNAPLFTKIKNIWAFHIKWTAPIVIVYILKALLY